MAICDSAQSALQRLLAGASTRPNEPAGRRVSFRAVGSIGGLSCASRSANPVIGTAFQVHHCQNPNVTDLMCVEQRVREPLAQPTPNGAADDGTGFRIFHDCCGGAPNLSEEGRTQTGPLVLVLPDGVVQLSFGKFVERHEHRQIRAWASRNTSSADRDASEPASRASSRRCASSAQRRAFSSGERSSRLSRSRLASRARPFGSSLSAAASSSSMPMIWILRHRGRFRSPRWAAPGLSSVAKISVVRHPNGRQPEFGEFVVPLHVNVRRLVPVAKKKTRYGPLCRTVGLTEGDSASFSG